MTLRVWILDDDDVVTILATAEGYRSRLDQHLAGLQPATTPLRLVYFALARTQKHESRVAAFHAIRDRTSSEHVDPRLLAHLDTVPDNRAQVLQILEQITQDRYAGY